MSEIINIGGLSATPGQRVHGLFPLEMENFLFLQQLSGAKNQVKQLSLQLVSTLVNMWEYRVQ